MDALYNIFSTDRGGKLFSNPLQFYKTKQKLYMFDWITRNQGNVI